jgi:hypothetical protein
MELQWRTGKESGRREVLNCRGLIN